MVEKGGLRLNNPVETFLSDRVKVPTYRGKKITLKHLATHTSGLPRLPDNSKVTGCALEPGVITG